MRKRENLIAFRTTEGSAMDAALQEWKRENRSPKAEIEGWAEMFSKMVNDQGDGNDKLS